MNVHRHPDTWIPPGQLGRRVRPYRPTFGDEPFINETHQGLAAVPLKGRLIDVGIPGWLRREDVLKLYEQAYHANGDVLEIGCAYGLSTAIIATALRQAGRGATLVAVDVDPDRVDHARRNLWARGLTDGVEFRVGDTADVCRELAAAGRTFGFVFVDHSHAYGPVLAVCRVLPDLVQDGGFCLIHDYNDARNDDPANPDYGVPQAVHDGLPPDQFAFYGIYGCTALYRKERGHDGSPEAGMDEPTIEPTTAPRSR